MKLIRQKLGRSLPSLDVPRRNETEQSGKTLPGDVNPLLLKPIFSTCGMKTCWMQQPAKSGLNLRQAEALLDWLENHGSELS
jgi:hypothetical protein